MWKEEGKRKVREKEEGRERRREGTKEGKKKWKLTPAFHEFTLITIII